MPDTVLAVGIARGRVVHLGAAIAWQETIGRAIRLATFDRQLWEAAAAVGLDVWPEQLG